jgi:predicted transposase/invertase (TIGR01784 family)
MSEDEANRMLYEARLKGREEGRQEGREEAKEDTARNALAKGFTPEIISEITGLDIETIRQLSPQQ